MIYLDTHVIVWLYSGNIHLISKNAQSMIENNSIAISPIVLLEIDFLYEIKRIQVTSEQIKIYLEQKIGLIVCDKSFAMICKNAALQKWTRDPFDRLITSHAAITKSTLITKDMNIRENYPQALW